MVFLIKKNARGDRSVSLRNNSYESDLAGLLEALKGLTLKIEVKITDVIKEAPVESQISEKDVALNQEEARLPVPEIPEKPKVSAIGSTKTPLAEKHEPLKCLNENKAPKRAEPKAPEIVEKPVPPPPERVMKLISDNSDAKKLVQEKVEKMYGTKPFVPQYPEGAVTVGSVIETCCIAVDDRGSTVFGYITYNDDQLVKTSEIINAFVEKIENSPAVTSAKVGDVVLAKSSDDNQWYRSVIERATSSTVDIFFFDWGLRETITIDRIKTLSIPGLKLSEIPACAVKLKFNAKSPELVEEFLRCETAFKLRIDSYDEATRAYNVTVLNA